LKFLDFCKKTKNIGFFKPTSAALIWRLVAYFILKVFMSHDDSTRGYSSPLVVGHY